MTVNNTNKNINDIWNLSRTIEALKWFPRSAIFTRGILCMFLDFLPRAENNGTFKRSRSYTILRQGQHKKRELGTKHLEHLSSCHMLHGLLPRAVGSKKLAKIHLSRASGRWSLMRFGRQLPLSVSVRSTMIKGS